MSQPTPYTRQYNFSDYQSLHPSDPLPAASVDAEFNAVKTTLDGTLTNLAKIQRDDGRLVNGVVTPDSLSTATLNVMGGWAVRGAWVTGTSYAAKDVASTNGIPYLCMAPHVAGTFATDLADGKWVALSVSLANAALTGVCTAATAAPLTNSTQIATTEYADAAVAVEAAARTSAIGTAIAGEVTDRNAAISTALTPYLLSATAASTYETSANAAATYETSAHAAATYALQTALLAAVPSQSGNNGKFLTTNGSATSWGGVPASPIKAWVNWTAGGTTVNASLNVSSVTRAAAGDYTVNFTAALADANYAVIGNTASSPGTSYNVSQHSGTTPTTTACRILITQSWTGSIADPSTNKISVGFLR